jgi:hypothetical protein
MSVYNIGLIFFRLTRKKGGDKWCILTFKSGFALPRMFSEKVRCSDGSRTCFQEPKTKSNQTF